MRRLLFYFRNMSWFANLYVSALVFILVFSSKGLCSGLWISQEEVRRLPMKGSAWERLKSYADTPLSFINLADQDNLEHLRVLAKALVYARLGEVSYKNEVIRACNDVIGTEKGASTLSIGKKLLAYIVSADLIGLPKETEKGFKTWLREILRTEFSDGRTIVQTHEKRPNNWGTIAGAARVGIAAYLDDEDSLKRCAVVFKGWLGDRKAYAGFKYKDLSWQADPKNPVGINPKGAKKLGHSIDGVLPDDQRRSGPFTWPPPKENYVYTALQGAVAQAAVLYRQGYDVWSWEDSAIRRAFEWLYNVADYRAKNDDVWLIYVINYYYGTDLPVEASNKPGKLMAWTDWTHEKKGEIK